MNRIIIYISTLLLSLHFLHAQSFNPALASRLQKTIDSILIAKDIKGISAGVYIPNMGTWQGVSGISHPGVSITSDMEFAIASNTKLFTAVLLLKLAEHNKLRLDDSLHAFLPSYKNIDSNITIRQLLNHTTGLDDVTSVPGYPDSILSNPRRVYTASELLTWAGPPAFAPGKGWEYCNTNYLLAGLIAEKVTGQSYGKLLRDSILTPLNLDSTFLDVHDSVLYTIAHPWQAGRDNSATPRISLNSAAGAAGAMYSTSSEMLQWYNALMNGKVINAQSIKEMTTFVEKERYGMGIAEYIVSGKPVWTHGGQIWGGYNSSMMYDPSTGIIICTLTNQLPAQAFQISVQMMTTVWDSTVGIDQSENAESKLYPNPTNDMVTISSEHAIQSIKVYDNHGNLVMESNESTFSITQLPSGTYHVRAYTIGEVHNYSLIKH
jgi:D-alanyl-D-alanine carboxypeptidase